MGISSSLSASVMGLNVNASKLSAISDNIANSGTNGYKRATVDFASVVTGQTPGRYDAGGVRVTTGREVTVRGSLNTSSNSTDMAINGRGLIPVTPVINRDDPADLRPLQMVPTGSFKPDDEGYLRTDSGLQLLGWPTNPDGTVSGVIRGSGASLQPVTIAGFDFASNPTDRIDLGLNVPVDATGPTGTGETYETGVEYFDELGASQQLSFSFTPSATTRHEWTMAITDSASTGTLGTYTVTFNGSGANAGFIASITEPVGDPAYDETSGSIPVPINGGASTITLNLGSPNEAGLLTQFASDFAPLGVTKNGTPVGGFNRVEITEEGFIEAIYDTGFRQTIYQIPVVDVPNPNGLTPLDNQAYTVSAESGPIFLWDAGSGPTGGIIGFALEQSATDIAQELTDLIQTQRAYSSNAKVVQTVDEMLQETNNIKR